MDDKSNELAEAAADYHRAVEDTDKHAKDVRGLRGLLSEAQQQLAHAIERRSNAELRLRETAAGKQVRS